MSGVTARGIRHPDGATKAKDLGAELKTMADDLDADVTAIDADLAASFNQKAAALDGQFTATAAQLESYVETHAVQGARGPQGLPGAEELPADDAVAEYIGTEGTSATKTALEAAMLDAIGDPAEAGYDVVLLLGQSNMSGWAVDGDIRIDPQHPKVFQFGTSTAYADVISEAIEPLAMVDVPEGRGPGLTFGRWAADSAKAGRRILLVPVAKGGSTFEGASTPAGWTWKVGRNDVVNLYNLAIVQAGKALTAAGANSRLVAALWLQGESDGNNLSTEATYAANLDALVTGLRTALGVPTLPFVVGQMVPENLPTGTRYAINNAHATTPARLANTAFSWAPFGAHRGDGNHFTAKGQRIIGRRMFDAYRRIVTGTPDPALPALPPAVAGVTVGTVTDSTVTLTWTAQAGAGAYYVERSVSPYTSWTLVATPTTNTTTATGLLPETTYKFRVRAINNNGVGTLTGSATPNATTAPLAAVSDNFNRPDSTTSLGLTTTGQTWGISAGVWGIAGNQGAAITPVNAGKAVVPFAAANQLVTAVIPTLTWQGGGATPSAGLVARLVDYNGYYVTTVSPTGVVSLFKRFNGGYTVLGPASAAGAFVAGNTLGLRCVGTSIEALINGIPVVSATDTTYSSGTAAGLWNGGTDTGKRWDSFAVTVV